MQYDVVVVGAGAAGMMAAAVAAERGCRVLLLEKNRKAGVKILMSGGTRCNLTHATDARGIAAAFPRDQARFLGTALAAFGPQSVIDLFAKWGVPTKTEATGKVFPISDRALDVQRAMLARLATTSAELSLGEALLEIDKQPHGFVLSTSRRRIECAKLLLTTGGQSYPGCGTTGDGYAWAKQLGHTIVPPRPALVPLRVDAAWLTSLQGITLPAVGIEVTVADQKKPVARREGSVLLTHFGLSGPPVLNVSREVTLPNRPLSACRVRLDWLPHISTAQLEADWQAAGASRGRQQVVTSLQELLPRRVAEELCSVARLPSDRTFAEFSRDERLRLVATLKQTELPLSGTLGFAKAEVTAGGVALAEVDPRTMHSKLCPGLYVAGELLDIDGPIGGFNFQAAFSAGYLAGGAV